MGYRQAMNAAAIAALVLAIGGCSGDSDPSIVSEARADAPPVNDYGWRAGADDSGERDGKVFEYH